NRGQRTQNRVVVGSLAGQDFLRRVALLLGDAQQQVLGRDVFVLEVVRFLESAIQNLVQSLRQVGLGSSTGNLGQAVDFVIDLAQHCLRPDANLFQNGRNDSFAVLDKGGQQVHWQNLGVTVFRGDLAGALNCLLRLHRKFVPTNSHMGLLRFL